MLLRIMILILLEKEKTDFKGIFLLMLEKYWDSFSPKMFIPFHSLLRVFL